MNLNVCRETDYCCGQSLAHDYIITGQLRVSTVEFPHYGMGSVGFSTGPLWETWIFSDIPQQRSRQIFHKTRAGAIIAHKKIVQNLRARFGY